MVAPDAPVVNATSDLYSTQEIAIDTEKPISEVKQTLMVKPNLQNSESTSTLTTSTTVATVYTGLPLDVNRLLKLFPSELTRIKEKYKSYSRIFVRCNVCCAFDHRSH